MKKFSFSTVVIRVTLLIGIIFSVFPFYWMLVMSSRTNSEIFSVPPYLTIGGNLIENMKEVLTTTNFFQSFINTVFVSVVSTILVLFFSTLAGYTFAKFNFKGKKILFLTLLSTMMIPGLLNIVPQYIMMDKIGWVGSYKAVIAPGLASAFGIFWIKQYSEGAIPTSIIEAARIDGSSEFGTYWRIALPIMRPAVAFLALYQFMISWNDYMWPLIILNDPAKYTLMLELTSLQGLYHTNYPLVISGTLLSIVPVLIVFIFFSKQLMAGLTAGAVKE